MNLVLYLNYHENKVDSWLLSNYELAFVKISKYLDASYYDFDYLCLLKAALE